MLAGTHRLLSQSRVSLLAALAISFLSLPLSLSLFLLLLRSRDSLNPCLLRFLHDSSRCLLLEHTKQHGCTLSPFSSSFSFTCSCVCSLALLPSMTGPTCLSPSPMKCSLEPGCLCRTTAYISLYPLHRTIGLQSTTRVWPTTLEEELSSSLSSMVVLLGRLRQESLVETRHS